MAAHPLDTLGFEPIASSAQRNPRSLADLGFETVMDTFRARRRWAPWNPLPAARSCSRRITLPSTRRWPPKPCLPTRPGCYRRSGTSPAPGWRRAAMPRIRHAWRKRLSGQGQPAETVSDYGAAQIAVASPEAKDAVVAAVKRHFPVLRQQDNFTLGDPEYHYRSYSLQVQMPNGSSEELQIVPDEVLRGKPAGAPRLQESAQRGTRGQDCRPGTSGREGHQRFRHGAVQLQKCRFDSDRVVKGPVVKGARVRLADGALARVLYVDPNMRIVRVRTEDGRNITVRHKDLRSS